MSQFSPPPDQAYAGAGEAPRTSRLAIASLITSLICCLPAVPLLGVLLGFAGLFSIGSNPMKKGKGLAVTGILLGLVLTAGQYFGGKFFYGFYSVVMKGPTPALTAGLTNNDLPGFRASFQGAGATASDLETQAFLGEVTKRYGPFIDAAFDQQQGQPKQTGQPQVTFSYICNFQNGPVNCKAEIVFADETTGKFVNKLGFITFEDPDLGDLTFPPPSAGGG